MSLRAKYQQALAGYIKLSQQNQNSHEIASAANDLHTSGTHFFSELEKFVLRRRQVDGYCGPELAEDCHSNLETIAMHFRLLREAERAAGLPSETYKPSGTAYSALQAAVKYHQPELVEPLRNQLKESNLPTCRISAIESHLISTKESQSISFNGSHFDAV